MARNIGFVRIDISRLALEFYSVLNSKTPESRQNKDARISEWTKSLVHCLVKKRSKFE